jgi:hypothetical protein
MTVIEIKPWRNGWKVFECPGVEPIFLARDQALDHAKGRANFRAGEIRLLDYAGKIERTVSFSEADKPM